MELKNLLIRFVNKKIEQGTFINDHKSHENSFTRNRVLTFPIMFLLILRKSIKSLQLMLNELFIHNHIARTVSSSAYNQARKKFKHTAFIELNEGTIDLFYENADIKRWKGYRVFGVDASTVILPKTKEIEDVYGSIKIKNKHLESSYTCALFECRYDVLNHLAVQCSLNPGLSYEVDLGIKLLEESKKSIEKDLDIYDRGYASYEFFSHLVHKQKQFVVRISRNSFKETRSLFSGIGPWNKIVTLKAPKDKKRELAEKNLPTSIEIRFVSVVLDTGEIEVLATSLIDAVISRKEFKELYFLRWGVEGFYNLVKGRLNLENFTGKSLESVQQDFWSTIFITNVETILTYETEKEINKNLNDDQLPQKINKAVSFNAIKNLAFDIFFNKKDQNNVEEKLTELFRTGTIVQRKDRSLPRGKISARTSLNFQKRGRKHVF
ncbi:MAG: IS4 family transposase [Legionella sp.]|nr:MAG: IS4 family transposase [Legionella sp.]